MQRQFMKNMQRFCNEIKINGARLWRMLMDMAKVGPGVAGGNNRQALTDADAEGRALFKEWCEAADMTVSADEMGNMFARRAGEDANAPPVCVGSHLDTQPTGGKFDGVLGVLAGLEIVQSLNDFNCKTKHPIAVINWTNEEGARFAPPMLGSGVFSGVYDLQWAYTREDAEGATLGDELARIGWVGGGETGMRQMRAYFELHIEQGPVLEIEKTDIGAVTRGQGMHWLEITLTGKESHTGSTPMNMRADAGLGMARIILALNEITSAHAPWAVGTVGHCEVFPKSRNIIPGKAVLTADFRHPQKAALSAMKNELITRAKAVANEGGLQISFRETGQYDPVEFDSDCVNAVRAAAARLGYSCRDLVSGAGHDACWISRIAPAAMVMCPCIGGLSHNEAEDISPEWAEAGANVLFHTVIETAGPVV